MNLPPESRSAFITCAFSMLGKIASADGTVSPEEVERVSRYIDSELRLEPKLKAIALELFEDAASSPLELRDYADKFGTIFQDRVVLLDQLVQLLLEVSAADGILDPREDKLVRSAALLLGLSEPAYERMKQKVFGQELN
ncbi:MAG: TerB family tellurite resistance protein [Bdellovibrionota bacterium]